MSKNNHHQNKYKVLRTKSEKLVREMAKKYGVRTPKVIKDLNKFKERVANKIEKIEYESKAQGFERMEKLNEINKFNKKFMKEIGDSNRAVKKFLDTNKKYPMNEVIEANIMIDEFGRKKITMDMVKDFAKKVNSEADDVINAMYDKVKAFELDSYSDVLKYYGFNNKDLKSIYKSYKKVGLRGRARILKVIGDFAKGSYKYREDEDSADRSNAKSNLIRIIDNEILDPDNKNKL